MSVFKTVCAIAVYFPQTVPDSVNHYISASYREETFLFIFIFPNRQDVTVAITALLSNCTATRHICFKSLRLFFINMSYFKRNCSRNYTKNILDFLSQENYEKESFTGDCEH